MIPKTVQEKKISSMSKDLNKILFILSKCKTQKEYSKIEYEIKQGVMKEYLSQIPNDIAISGNCNL